MKRPRPKSLFWSIAGVFLVTALFGTAVQALLAVAILRPLENREIRARAELAVSGVVSALENAPTLPSGAELDTLLARHHARAGVRRLTLAFHARGGAIATAPPGFARLAARELSGASGEGDGRGGPGGRRRRQELLVERVVIRAGAPVGEVMGLRPMRPPALPSGRSVLLFLPIAIVVSVAGGLVVVRMLVSRLRAMEELAGRVAEGDLEVRISDPSQDEIGRLAQRLNRMTERLAEAREHVAATDRQRRQLLADIGHELATPLTTIRGNAEMLLDPSAGLPESKRAHYLRGVLDESRRLGRLIGDLFELARLEAGATSLEREPLDLAALCRNVVERFEPRFQRAGLRLEWNAPAGEAWVEADGLRIEQVVENLLVNALRYVPQGGAVVVGLSPSPRPGAPHRLTVTDDGPGMAPAEMSHVFERFFRGEHRVKDATGEHGGSGLGLAIVREIVQRHGGAVRARPNTPHGLVIEIELPPRA